MSYPSNFLSATVGAYQTALFNSFGRVVTYGQLRDLSAEIKGSLSKGFVLARISNDLDSVKFLVAAIEARVPVMVVDEKVDSEYFENLIHLYKPNFLYSGLNDYPGFKRLTLLEGEVELLERESARSNVHPSLGLMLGTSGSTGNPKFVRLSHEAIRSNAVSIAEGLNIVESDVAVTCLPCSYSYGLSIVNTHLALGASVLVTNESVVSEVFWTELQANDVTSFAGVPTTYRMLKQMRWSPARYPSLRYMTQAGGKLNDEDRKYFLDLLKPSGIQFIVMYGQTEATARITICPQNLLEKNITTAGPPIPNGTILISEPDASGVGDVIYSGPNVMMGYAESEIDLKRGDELSGLLRTGDLGYQKDGMLFLTGRAKRIVKVFGVRISLDDVDNWVSEFGNGVAIQGDDSVVIFIESPKVEIASIKRAIANRLGVHPSGVRVSTIESWPLLTSGKIDMQFLTHLAQK